MLIYKNTRIKNYSENMTDEELVEFCALNKELRIERDKHRNIHYHGTGCLEFRLFRKRCYL
jgi:hypothetical protein